MQLNDGTNSGSLWPILPASGVHRTKPCYLLAGVDAVAAALALYLTLKPTPGCQRAALRLLLSPNLLQQLTFAAMLTV